MELDTRWLETILVRHTCEKNIARVAHLETESVVEKGDNYASDITRVKMDVYLGSGRKAKRSLIVKTLPESKARHLQEFGVFKKEIMMYTKILPIMSWIMEEAEDKEEPLWVECIDYTPYVRLVLQDLKELGYGMADRREGLDFNHAALTLRNLGKLHALTVVMKERSLLNPDDFPNPFKEPNQKLMDDFYKSAFGNMKKVIETTWPEEEKIYAKKLANIEDSLPTIVQDLIKKDDTRFNVLNHSDCWVNNIMFKYADDGKTPVAMRFIDFQMSQYNSYGLDLQYFFTTSLKDDIRNDETINKLLEVYQRSLKHNMSRYHSTAENVPTLEEVKAEVQRLEYFGVSIAFTALTFMKTDPEDAPNIEELMNSFEKNENIINIKPYLGKAFTEAVRCIFKRSAEKGLI